MGIEIPASLQWVSYLAGSQWPQGDETAMFRIGGDWQAAAGELDALVPELGWVRAQTQSVLTGETAAAADEQFALLFDGEYAVDQLVAAMAALGGLAEQTATAIEYTKLQILTTLGIAALSIGWALYSAWVTGGASLAEIPAVEAAATLTIRELVSMLLGRIRAALASTLSTTTVKRLLVEGAASAGIGGLQEAGIEGYQIFEGHRDGFDGWQVAHSMGSFAAAGAAGGLVGHGVGEVVGKHGSRAVRAAKGALAAGASAEAANAAGTAAGGGDLTAETFLGGAIGFVDGAVRGTAGHPARGGPAGGGAGTHTGETAGVGPSAPRDAGASVLPRPRAGTSAVRPVTRGDLPARPRREAPRALDGGGPKAGAAGVDKLAAADAVGAVAGPHDAVAGPHDADARGAGSSAEGMPAGSHVDPLIYVDPLIVEPPQPHKNPVFAVVDELSARYPGRDFPIDADPTSKEVPARALFEAVNSAAEPATYAEVREAFDDMPDNSSAIVASKRAQGADVFLVEKDDGELYVVDPRTGERSLWPPQRGEDLVSHAAVGYLDEHGHAVNPLHDTATQPADDETGHSHTAGDSSDAPDRTLADAALDRRVPPVPAEGLVTDLRDAGRAAAGARENDAWMAGLPPGEEGRALIDALIEAHPYEIGNAWGIRVEDCDTANRLALQGDRDRADELWSKRNAGQRLNAGQRKFIKRVDRIEPGLREVDRAAERAGVGAARLLAFDPTAFRGDGRAVICFGADPYQPETKVSWWTARQPIDKLGETLTGPALDQLRLDQREGPAAAIVWIGKIPLPGSGSRSAFYSDRAAFRAVREAQAETGEAQPLTKSPVYALRPVSTTEPTARASTLWLHPDSDPLVFAHRGASELRPENTWAAIELALRRGANAIEVDVHLTKDGHPVVIHDPRVDRASDGTGFVRRKTLAELRELDFGVRHPSRALGEAQGDTGILTLDELLERLQDNGRPVTLFIETKHLQDPRYQLERKVVALLQDHGLANPAPGDQFRAAVTSSHPDALVVVHRLAQELPTVLLTPPLHSATQVSAYLLAAKRAHVSAVSFYRTLRAFPELVDLAHSRGLNVWAGVVRDAIEAQYLADLGVDIIGSNHPARTNAWLGLGPTDSALDRRVPPVPAEGLVTDLRNGERAAAGARENDAWMAGLPPGEEGRALIDALIEAHPHEIGNAWGLRDEDCDKANRLALQGDRDRADELRSKRNAGQRLNAGQRKFVERMDRIEPGLREVDRAAERAGVGAPLWRAFDLTAFRGNGRAVIRFGADPYQPETQVSWWTARQPIDELGETLIRPALDQLRLDQREGPAAAIVWIGNNTLPGSAFRNAFYSDHAAFRAVREAQAGTGEARFTRNRVYALTAHGTDRTPANALWVPQDAGPRAIVHRLGFPENTWAGCKKSLDQGATALECDVQLTKDGIPVVIHDPWVNRTSDGAGFVSRKTLAELRELDFGVRHPSAKLGEAQGDTGILTLDELLKRVKNYGRPVTLFIETKHYPPKYNYDVERKVVALLKDHGLADPASGEQPGAAVISFHPDGLAVAHRLAPRLPTVYLAPRLDIAPLVLVTATHGVAQAIGANGISHYIHTLRAYPELVDLAAAQGMIVYPGVVNNQRDAAYARDLGVSWIGTDHPGRVNTWLGRGPADSDEGG